MSASAIVLALVTLQRLGELVLARRNTRRLLARGAVEAGAGHYAFVVAVHAAWLAGLWWLAPEGIPNPAWLAAFVALQAVRLWVLASLGGRWTTRIVVLPDAPLVRRGPYRFVSHPNYAVVVGEIAALPLAFGLPGFALLFSILNAAALAVRVRAENAALWRARPLAAGADADRC